MDRKTTIKLKENLPRGFTKILADANGCSKQYVSQIIKGNNITHPIYLQALDLAKKHQEELKRLQKEISSL